MSNTCDSTITGPSQQNPDECSQEYTPISSLNRVSSLLNPPDKSLRSFSVQLKSARVLKQVIQALCDSGTMVAQIHVTEQGFKITTGDEEMGLTSYDSLSSLLASDLTNPVDVHNTRVVSCVCHWPSIEPMVVNLAALSWSLRQVHNDDTLTFYQVIGSNNLSIMCENSYPRSGLSFNFPSFNPNLLLDDNIRSFSFELTPAGTLKQAIHVLCDSAVNELGLAYIHADEKGFQITVDSNDGCIAVFFMPAIMLRNFQCSKPSTVAQIANLAEVSWNLAPVDDDDTVTVYKVDGSNQHSFMIVACAPAHWSVAMLFTNVPGNIGKLPQIVSYCEGRVRSSYLMGSFEKFSQEAIHRRLVVTVEIEHDDVKFDYLDMGYWKADFRQFMDVEKGMARGQKYRAWFECNFTKALRNACELVAEDAEVEVWLSSVPAGNVVFQFNLTEAGPVSHLLILKRTLGVYPDADNIERLSTALDQCNVM